MPRRPPERNVLAIVGIVAVVLLLYSILVLRDLLAWLGLLVPLLFLYLAWRFVLAHERIADALETERNGRNERDPTAE